MRHAFPIRRDRALFIHDVKIGFIMTTAPQHIACLMALLTLGSLAGCSSEKKPVTAESSQYKMDTEKEDATVAANSSNVNPESSATASPAVDATESEPANPIDLPPTSPPVSDETPAPRTYTVPSGPPAELTAFISMLDERFAELQNSPPEVSQSVHIAMLQGDPQAMRAFQLAQQAQEDEQIRVLNAKLEASEALLDSKESTEESRLQGRRSQLEALTSLVPYDDSHVDRLTELARELSKDPNADLASLGRSVLFNSDFVKKLGDGTITAAEVLAEGKAILAESPKTEAVFVGVQQGVSKMFEGEHYDEGLELLTALGNAYEDSEDERLAGAAAQMLNQRDQIRVAIKMDQVRQGNQEAKAELVAAVKDVVTRNGAGFDSFELVSQVARGMEFSGEIETAKQLYEIIKSAFAESQNPELAEFASATTEKAATRLALVGGPVEVTGTKPGGEPIDWESYRGKVVLLDFWATWCRPCIAELPNLMDNYEKYHEHGFEIVGINIDDSPEDMAGFLARNPLPWFSVRRDDVPEQGFDNPNCVKFGVDGIPFLVLVGRDGNVLALHTRGPQLGERLAELFPDVDVPSEDPAADPATPDGVAPPADDVEDQQAGEDNDVSGNVNDAAEGELIGK